MGKLAMFVYIITLISNIIKVLSKYIVTFWSGRDVNFRCKGKCFALYCHRPGENC